MIDITSDILKANVLLNHIEGSAPKAIMRALNRTVDGAKTDIVKQVTANYNIKPNKIRKVIKATHARTGTLLATVSAKGSHIPLIQFSVTPKSPGQQPVGSVLMASVKKSGGKPIPGAFIMQIGDKTEVAKREGKDRIPTVEITGPSLPQMINDPIIQQYIMDGMETRFSKRIDHEIEAILSGSVNAGKWKE
jgi:hypothetical protein